MVAHTVRQGECIGCIAFQYGQLPTTVWDDPANTALKDLRKDPNVLQPADVVQIPDLRLKEESCASEKKHRFKRKGIPSKLQVEIRLQDRELANEEFELTVGGTYTRGRTDANGKIEVRIPPDAPDGWLRIRGRKIPFSLGTLDPVGNTTGLQQRLRQLGYPCGAIDGVHGPLTSAAVRAYQGFKGLTENGQADRPTQAKIKEDYGG